MSSLQWKSGEAALKLLTWLYAATPKGPDRVAAIWEDAFDRSRNFPGLLPGVQERHDSFTALLEQERLIEESDMPTPGSVNEVKLRGEALQDPDVVELLRKMLGGLGIDAEVVYEPIPAADPEQRRGADVPPKSYAEFIAFGKQRGYAPVTVRAAWQTMVSMDLSRREKARAYAEGETAESEGVSNRYRGEAMKPRLFVHQSVQSRRRTSAYRMEPYILAEGVYREVAELLAQGGYNNTRYVAGVGTNYYISINPQQLNVLADFVNHELGLFGDERLPLKFGPDANFEVPLPVPPHESFEVDPATEFVDCLVKDGKVFLAITAPAIRRFAPEIGVKRSGLRHLEELLLAIAEAADDENLIIIEPADRDAVAAIGIAPQEFVKLIGSLEKSDNEWLRPKGYGPKTRYLFTCLIQEISAGNANSQAPKLHH